MTELVLEKRLNTGGIFTIGSNTYNVIAINADDDKLVNCLCRDRSNHASVVSLEIEALPKAFQLYVYDIKNWQEFQLGRVIFAYSKEEKTIHKTNGIVIKCTRAGISFSHRNIGGEIVRQMITGNQIKQYGIKILLYDEPKIV